jgi:predicted transcriptional regulator
MVLEGEFANFASSLDKSAAAEASLASLQKEIAEINSKLTDTRRTIAKDLHNGGEVSENYYLREKLGIVNDMELHGYEGTLEMIE